MKKGLLLIGIAALLLSQMAGAEVYRWTDKDGRTHYSDNPPPGVAAKPARLHDSNIDVEKLPWELRQVIAKYPLTLYVADSCGAPCEQARSWLKQRKAPFGEKSIKTAEDANALKALTGGDGTRIPVLQVGSKALVNFDSAAWAAALDDAGYPK